MTACRFCGGALRGGAPVCPDCDRFQDWRRFLSIGNAGLSLIVAALSVATVLWTTVASSLFVSEEVALFGAFPELHVANLGDRPVLVTGMLAITAGGIAATGRLAGDGPVVNPGESGRFALQDMRSDVGPVVVRSFEIVHGAADDGDCVAVLDYVSGGRTTDRSFGCHAELVQ